MGTTTPVFQSLGTVLVLYVTLNRHVNQDSHNVQSLQHLMANLVHNWLLATGEFFNYLRDHQHFRLCLFLRHPTISQGRICISLLLLNTAWTRPWILLLLRPMICQISLEPNQKSLSISSLNYSHTWVFALATISSAALLACQYPSAVSGEPLHTQNASFTGVHQQIFRLAPRLCSASPFTRVSKTFGLSPDDNITKSIIGLRSRVLWYDVHLWATLCLNMVFMKVL